MLNLTETAIRLYRHFFDSPKFSAQLSDGIEMVLDGNTAIAVTEACITEVATLGGGFVEHGAALAWLSEQQRVTTNLFDEQLSVQYADSPRGALAAAMGVTLSGHRSTVFLCAQDLSTCQDLIQTAAGRHLPLVIHLDNRLSAMQSTTMGSGHDVVHQLMDSGCFVLFATNVQEAVDFTLIARHVAELTLTPAVVVVDGTETALSVQDVCLPSTELVKQFIGRADDFIKSPSIAQKQLFSEQRRRIHNWYDLDKPVLQGALQEPQLFALARAASETYFYDQVQKTLEQAFIDYVQLSSRQYHSISSYGLKKSDIIVIAQGSAIETLNACRKYLNSVNHKRATGTKKIKLGIIGLHSLRPFNSSALVELILKGQNSSQPIIVLERMNVALADDAPLMRELRAALLKYRQQKHLTLDRQLPQLRSVIYGLGGSALNITDLFTLFDSIATTVNNESTQKQYLGVPFISYDLKDSQSKTKESHPKRQVMLDTLERYYPHINGLGINAKTNEQDLCSAVKNSLNFAISYIAHEKVGISYAMDLSSFLYRLKKSVIRTSLSSSWKQWSNRHTDFVCQAETPYAIGSACLANFFLLLSTDASSLLFACQKMADQGTLIFLDNFAETLGNSSSDDIALIEQSLKLIQEKKLTLYNVEVSDFQETDDELLWEQMLATLSAVLLNKELINLKARKVISLRESLLADHEMDISGSNSDQQNNKKQSAFKEKFTGLVDELSVYQSEKQLKALVRNIMAVSEENPVQPPTHMPEMVKKLGQASECYDNLPRFWDQLGILHQAGKQDQLTADPYLATGTIPSLSATFNDMSNYRSDSMPVFNPLACTACGDCWSNCPESAIATVLINPKALIETAIELSAADALRSVSSKLASVIAKQCRNTDILEAKIVNSGDLFKNAFDWFRANAGMPEERLHSIESQFDKACSAIAELPVVVSELFFYAPEKQQNDTGELLSLVINPDSCKACGLCVQLCAAQASDTDPVYALNYPVHNEEQDALQLSPQEIQNSYKKQWQIWQKTPDTASATIERVLRDQSMQAGSALMLSRYNAFALSGGDQGELASGEKIAMRQLLSATEYQQQPILFQFISQIKHLKDELTGEINHNLSEALPTDNLTLLAEKLSDVSTRQIDLNSLLEQNTQTMDSRSIDASRIHQLVSLVLQLNELHWKLSEGIYGIGRARYSLCITSSSIASWAAAFPHNPFHVPVNIDVTGESASVAAGLMRGQIQDVLFAVSIIRQARAAIDSRYARQTNKLKHLKWLDLTEEEQQLCPPLFLVGGDDLLGTHGFSQIALLLNSSYPLKIVVFNELDCGLTNSALHEYQLNRRQDSRNNLAMMAMSQQNAYVAQTSIADNNHFQQSVQQLLSNTNAGMICVHTPSPQRHGFKPELTIRQAELAVQSGMYPLFQYNPRNEGVFGTRLTLHESIAQKNTATDVITEINPVHWAINEHRFQAHFSELTANSLQPVELADWLLLSKVDKTQKTPFIMLFDDETEAKKIAISKDFALMVGRQQAIWRTLQELAGIETPFTDYVEQCVAERLGSEHQSELDQLRAEYEAKIALINANYTAETHTKIRNQLLELAGYDATNLSSS